MKLATSFLLFLATQHRVATSGADRIGSTLSTATAKDDEVQVHRDLHNVDADAEFAELTCYSNQEKHEHNKGNTPPWRPYGDDGKGKADGDDEEDSDGGGGRSLSHHGEEEEEAMSSGSSEREKPKPILTLWQCGSGKKLADDSDAVEVVDVDAKKLQVCECTVSRVIDFNTIPDGQAVALNIGEYSSKSQCNANCGRGPDDICWVCVSTQIFPGGDLIKQCKHVQDTWIDAPRRKQGFKCCPLEAAQAYVEKYCWE